MTMNMTKNMTIIKYRVQNSYLRAVLQFCDVLQMLHCAKNQHGEKQACVRFESFINKLWNERMIGMFNVAMRHVYCHFVVTYSLQNSMKCLHSSFHLSSSYRCTRMEHNRGARVLLGIQTMIFQSGAVCVKVSGTQLDNQQTWKHLATILLLQTFI